LFKFEEHGIEHGDEDEDDDGACDESAQDASLILQYVAGKITW
jgi:hypothetical protein